MKLIKPYIEIIPQGDVIEHIELCGRICYKSEDQITDDSAKKFVETLIKSGHTSVLEHGTIYLKCKHEIARKYHNNKYSVINLTEEKTGFLKNYHYFAVTTNYRVLVENGWLDDLKYQCEPTEYHIRRITVKFVCDRGISHELVRHRVFSFSQESTRYCNYSKDKFDNSITFIEPCYLNKLASNGMEYNLDSGYSDMFTIENYKELLQNIENLYHAAIIAGLKPQEARMILPNSLKTEVIMTGNTFQWKEFFRLRCSNAAHPQMRELAIPLKETFKKLNYV